MRVSMFAGIAGMIMILPAWEVRAEKPELVSVVKIWDQGQHNAFVDLTWWHDRWFCVFREAEAHVGGDGAIRVLSSRDGTRWESVARITEEGIDLRDPHLSITSEDRLMIVAGGSVYRGKTLLGRQPRVLFSRDGQAWTPPQRVLEEGDWLWRVTWHRGKAYGVSYNSGFRTTPAAKDKAVDKAPPLGSADGKFRLFSSVDGVRYDLVTNLEVSGSPNETTLRFLDDGRMIALVRREAGNAFGWIGQSRPPYTQWTWHETGHRLGGPDFLPLPNGQFVAGSRVYPGGPKMALARMSLTEYEPVLTLPSGGDCSYPGIVLRDGLLWVAYYASHEGKSAIYLAKVKWP